MKARVIKRSEAPSPTSDFENGRLHGVQGPFGSRVVDREVFAAHERARALLESARDEAARLVRDGEEQARLLARQARDQAFEESLAEWETRWVELNEARQQVVEEARPQIVELAMEVASKILRHRLETVPEAIAPVLEGALKTVRSSLAGHLVVNVHPGDVPAVERCRAELMVRDPRWEALDVLGDPEMTRGGCRVESELGEIDASVETQLGALRLLLREEGRFRVP